MSAKLLRQYEHCWTQQFRAPQMRGHWSVKGYPFFGAKRCAHLIETCFCNVFPQTFVEKCFDMILSAVLAIFKMFTEKINSDFQSSLALFMQPRVRHMRVKWESISLRNRWHENIAPLVLLVWCLTYNPPWWIAPPGARHYSITLSPPNTHEAHSREIRDTSRWLDSAAI